MFSSRRFFLGYLLLALLSGGFIVYKQYQKFYTPVTVTQEMRDGQARVTIGPDATTAQPIRTPTYDRMLVADQYLKDDGYGIDVLVDGVHRFYPFQLLTWHELVMDTQQNKPFAVFYSPLTQVAVAFERTVGGEVLEFVPDGTVLNSETVLQDQHDRHWVVSLGTTLPATSAKLSFLPTTRMTWSQWKALYPSGVVLSKATDSTFDYTRDPYQAYLKDPAIVWYPVSHLDDRMPVKDVVVSLVPDSPKAFPLSRLLSEGVLADADDQVRPYVLLADKETSIVQAFSASYKGVTLRLSKQKDGAFQDEDSKSIWNAFGVCVAGKYKGGRLTSLPLLQSYWFSFVAFHPGVEVDGM